MPDHARFSVSRFLLCTSWLGLFVLLAAPIFFSDTASIGLWFMLGLPMLLTLPGVWRNHSRSLQWLCFLVLFCFIQGVLQIFSVSVMSRWTGALTCVCCIVLFTAAIVILRSKSRPPVQEQ